MLLARELSGQSAQLIARFFGRKNHTTVVHACRRTRALLAADPSLAHDVERLRRELARYVNGGRSAVNVLLSLRSQSGDGKQQLPRRHFRPSRTTVFDHNASAKSEPVFNAQSTPLSRETPIHKTNNGK